MLHFITELEIWNVLVIAVQVVLPFDRSINFYYIMLMLWKSHRGYRTFIFLLFFLPGSGKKEKMRKGTTHSSAKAKSTPIMSTKIFSDTFGVQNITKQS